MKKKVIFTGVLFVSVCAAITFGYQHRKTEQLEIVADTTDNVDIEYDIRELKELEELSDIIIKATVLPGSQNIPHEVGVRKGRTYTDVQIQTVYKGEVNPGDIINITEQYYYENDGKELHILNGYLPSEVGSEYLFFLGISAGESEEEHYLMGVERGRYSKERIDTVQGKPIEKDNFVYLEDTRIYGQLRREVLNKYYS